MRGNLLNGIPTRERRVTNDDAANPRTTLTCGLCAPVPVRSRFPEDAIILMHALPAVSRGTSRDLSAWAANMRLQRTSVVTRLGRIEAIANAARG
jgi:hypothetical protein